VAGFPWFSAALAALPHITDLVKASKELLKNRKPAPSLNVSTIDLNDPLARVAAVCENNTESIRLLTEQMQSQLEQYQKSAVLLRKRLHQLNIISAGAIVVAVIALAKAFNAF
jgi:hypothetical protein